MTDCDYLFLTNPSCQYHLFPTETPFVLLMSPAGNPEVLCHTAEYFIFALAHLNREQHFAVTVICPLKSCSSYSLALVLVFSDFPILN